MPKEKIATLVFLLKRSEGETTHICLAEKKRGFGMGRWNGVGGKVEEGKETIDEAARREVKEEIGVDVGKLEKVAEIASSSPNWKDGGWRVNAYLCEQWGGDPTESDEMNPKWFTVGEIPFNKMWPDEFYWLPVVLSGKKLCARFVFGEADVIMEKELMLVSKFE